MWSFRQFSRSIRALGAVLGLGMAIAAVGCGRDQLAPGGGSEHGGTSGVGGSNPNPDCGDGICEGNEPRTCPRDCDEPGCGDGYCDFSSGEPEYCPVDCQTCGNGYCDDSDWSNCPWECTCNDGVCDPEYDPVYCPSDCPRCGNGACEFNEDVFNCSLDCGY